MPFHVVTGHRRLVALLARAVAQDRVPPSLLLAGPQGVGKRKVAQALAPRAAEVFTAEATSPVISWSP